jgi:hypothetical protein
MDSPPRGDLADRGLALRRTSTLMAAVAAIGLWLGLTRTYPEANVWLLLLALFAGPPAYFARRKVLQYEAQGEPLQLEDRIALFLCLSLFTIPITVPFAFLLLCVVFLLGGGGD